MDNLAFLMQPGALNPLPAIEAARARLLRTVLTLCLPLGVLLALIPPLTAHVSLLDPRYNTQIVVYSLALWVVIYALAFTRYYYLAAWLSSLTAIGTIILTTSRARNFSDYFYLLFVLVFATLFFKRRDKFIVLFLIILAIFISPLITPLDTWKEVLDPALTVILGILFFLVAEEHQREVERHWMDEAVLYGLRFRKLLQDSQWGTATLKNGAITECDAQFARLLGYPPGQLRGMPIQSLVTMNTHPADAEIIEAEAKIKDGPPLPVELLFTPNHHADDGAGVIAIRDITPRKQQEENLRQQAYRDPLTGLYNRTYLMNYLQMQLTYPSPIHQVAVLFVDLDNFKQVNDQFGHHVGDRVLAEVAQRLRSAVRDEDIVARYGGDEFVLICKCAPEITNTIVQRTNQALEKPFHYQDQEFNLSASIGVLPDIRRYTDPHKVLQDADAMMYQQKFKRFPEKSNNDK